MSITTKTGDTGTTAVYGGKRVSKAKLQIEAYGKVDEATSFLGLAIEAIPSIDVKDLLSDVQLNLYHVMAFLSGADLKNKEVSEHLQTLDNSIIQLEKDLPRLVRFVLPQGSEQTARLHVARAVVRTAERRVVEYFETINMDKQERLIIQYLNRLSDLLFLLARKYTIKERLT